MIALALPLRTATARRLVMYTLLCSSCVAVLATGLQLLLDFRGDVQTMDRQLEEIDRSQGAALSRTLWVEDRDLLDVQVRGMLALPGLVHAEVSTPHETVLALGHKPTGASLTRDVPLAHTYHGRSRRLGTLTLVASYDAAYERLWQRLVVLLATNTAKALLVGLFMLLIFRHLVTRHLHHIARYATQLGAARLDEPLVLDRRATRPEDDELEACAVALNETRVKLRRALKEREEMAATLEDRVRELERFGYSLSHDISAPLRTIESMAELLRDDHSAALDPEGKDLLRRIGGASERMRRLIRSMLTLSGLSARPIDRHRIDLSALVTEVAGRLAAQNPERCVHVHVAAGLMARADPALLTLALDNLLANAWKFTRSQGAARIDFGAEPRGGEVVYHVRDNGIGFESAFQERIFEPFERLHGPADYPGSGIGLSIVRTVIARHGGRVWSESTLGAGATFYFTLGE